MHRDVIMTGDILSWHHPYVASTGNIKAKADTRAVLTLSLSMGSNAAVASSPKHAGDVAVLRVTSLGHSPITFMGKACWEATIMFTAREQYRRSLRC